MRFSKRSPSGQAAIEFILFAIVLIAALAFLIMTYLDNGGFRNGRDSPDVELTQTGTIEGKYIDSTGFGKSYYVTVRNGSHQADHEVSLAEYNAAAVGADFPIELADSEFVKADEAQAQAYNGMENPYLLANRYIDIMPKVAEQVAKPLTAVDSIKMYGSGNAQKLVKETTSIVDQVASGLKDSTGIDLPSLLNGLISNSDTHTDPAESPVD